MASGRIPSVEGGIQPTIVDAKGDLIVGTAADTVNRLAVGTNNYVLTADSAETTGLKWAAPSSGALTLISRQTFSNVASATMDSVFSSTYTSYEIVIESFNSGSEDDVHIIMRHGTTDVTNYYGNMYQTSTTSNTWTNIASNNSAQLTIGTASSTTYPYRAVIDVVGIGTSTRPYLIGHAQDGAPRTFFFGGYPDSAQTYTGFKLKSASANIDLTVAVYGKAK